MTQQRQATWASTNGDTQGCPEGWRRDREHYLLANDDGLPTQGWMETHESYPAP